MHHVSPSKSGELHKSKGKGNKDDKKYDRDGLTDDDRTMLRMKEENPSLAWSVVFEATKNFKNVSEAKARYKEISKHNDNEPVAGEQQSKKETNKNKNKNKKGETDEERAARIERQKEEGQRKKAEKLAANGGGTTVTEAPAETTQNGSSKVGPQGQSPASVPADQTTAE
jgi:hypothetical protein